MIRNVSYAVNTTPIFLNEGNVVNITQREENTQKLQRTNQQSNSIAQDLSSKADSYLLVIKFPPYRVRKISPFEPVLDQMISEHIFIPVKPILLPPF